MRPPLFILSNAASGVSASTGAANGSPPVARNRWSSVTSIRTGIFIDSSPRLVTPDEITRLSVAGTRTIKRRKRRTSDQRFAVGFRGLGQGAGQGLVGRRAGCRIPGSANRGAAPANAVSGATSPSGSPYAGSFSLPQVAHDQVPERSSTGDCGGSSGNASEVGG